MIRIILHGAAGIMGKMVADQAKRDEDIKIVCGIDVTDGGSAAFPIFTDIDSCDVEADVVIDFSVAAAADKLIAFCDKNKLPLVLCTTGLSDEQIKAAQALSQKTAVLRAANMSLGVNAMLILAADAAKVFAPAGFDMEIMERHHNRKLDAPSGTALAIADSINDALDGDYEYTFDRSNRREKRKKNEIGISAMRGGNIVGYHEVVFAGEDEVVTITHQATSRAVFAKGAIEAAKYIYDKPAGMYDMKDVTGLEGQ